MLEKSWRQPRLLHVRRSRRPREWTAI